MKNKINILYASFFLCFSALLLTACHSGVVSINDNIGAPKASERAPGPAEQRLIRCKIAESAEVCRCVSEMAFGLVKIIEDLDRAIEAQDKNSNMISDEAAHIAKKSMKEVKERFKTVRAHLDKANSCEKTICSITTSDLDLPLLQLRLSNKAVSHVHKVQAEIRLMLETATSIKRSLLI